MNARGKSEGDLRQLLRHCWNAYGLGAPLTWVEAAPGGTLGAPDLLVPISGHRLFGLELKAGWVRRDGCIDIKLRPNQRRWHRDMNMHGYPSGVLAFVNVLGEDKKSVQTSLNLFHGACLSIDRPLTISLSEEFDLSVIPSMLRARLLLAFARIADMD